MLLNTQTVPQLNTEFIAPLLMLEQTFIREREAIEAWFKEQWQQTPPPVYGSVDLRNGGYKVAPIDMNLFPAGFNNLNPALLSHASEAAKNSFERLVPNAQKILLIPEEHTRNLFYWRNVQTLQKLLEGAGFTIQFGTLDEDVSEPFVIQLEDSAITLYPLKRNGNHLQVEQFDPDVILLNNDLSSGIPPVLQSLEQVILPPVELGWSQRLKSGHFQCYAAVADDFAARFKIDPWLLAPLFRQCGEVDFMQQEGTDCLVNNVDALFAAIKEKYAQYNIPHQPFIIVKADAGTYGMAVMTVRDPDELRKLNRKQRTRMATTKGGQNVNKVIIQEGVHTFETIGDEQSVAEPVVYLMGTKVVGGFYRVHKDRGVDENLNSPGMHFEPIAFSQRCDNPCAQQAPDACQNRLYLYGIVARLSMLAAAREMKDHTNA